jgi:hypothetical protein
MLRISSKASFFKGMLNILDDLGWATSLPTAKCIHSKYGCKGAKSEYMKSRT